MAEYNRQVEDAEEQGDTANENPEAAEVPTAAQTDENQETGATVVFTVDGMQLKGQDGNTVYVRGARIGNTIYVQADHPLVTATQIADHEAFHAKANRNGKAMIDQLAERIASMDKDAFDRVVDKYAKALEAIYDTSDYDAFMRIVAEEMLADAYSGINAFGAHAEQFGDTVNQWMDEHFIGKKSEAEVEQLRGPPEGERFSVDDSSFANADEAKKAKSIVQQLNDNLDRIMQMEAVTVVSDDAVSFANDRKTDAQTGYAIFLSQGGKAYRPSLGEVLLSHRGARETVNHGNGKAKQAMFPAVKPVIEQGIEIFRDINHNEGTFDTITFAAPAMLGNNKIAVAAVVKEYINNRGNRSFYVHEICDSNGNFVTLDDGDIKKDSTSSVGLRPTPSTVKEDNLPANSIDQSVEEVKQNFSVDDAMDSDGNRLTAQQAEYFADSKVRDENGNLLAVYHGTPTGGFNEFMLPEYLSKITSRQGAGYYFADERNAAQYQRASNGKTQKQAQLYKVYLNITNPLEITEFSKGKISPEAFREIISRGTRQWGVEHTDVEKILSWNLSDADLLQEMVSAYTGDSILPVMREVLGYDGVRFRDNYGDIWVAWDKNQIKRTDNLNPTESNDIRFSVDDAEYLRLAENPAQNYDRLNEMVRQAAEDAGYNNLFYHGAKNGGGFTRFRDWQYFTENRKYAQRYAKRDTSGSLYETYVKMENPFDTREPEAMRIFEEARGELGLGEIQDTGLPDWTDGYDLADYIEENGLAYDGIILDEGGDMVNGEPVSRGLSYVVRNSAQIKSSDVVTYDDSGNIIPLSERFNPQNDDIRFSVDDYDYQDFSWAVNDGILSPLELRKVESAVVETVAQGYNSHSFNDALSIAMIDGTKAALFRGSMEQPVIDYVIQCDTGIDQDEIVALKEYFEDAQHENAVRIAEDYFSDEGIRIFSREDSVNNERQNERGTRDDSNASYRGYQGRENQVNNAKRRYGPSQAEVDESLERMRTTIREEEAQKFSIDDGQEEQGGDTNTRNGSTVRQEVKATYAKSNLRSKVQTIFSIQPGNRSIASAMLNDVADRYLRNGYITEEDRQNFFGRMVELGTVTVPDSSAFLRPYQSLTESLIHKKGLSQNSFSLK